MLCRSLAGPAYSFRAEHVAEGVLDRFVGEPERPRDLAVERDLRDKVPARQAGDRASGRVASPLSRDQPGGVEFNAV